MTSPNFCPNCGEDLTKYKEQETSNDEDKPTREDYKRILNEELEKAEKESNEGSEEGKSGENLTREDYEEVLERKLKEVEEAKQKDTEVDPEVQEAVKKLLETDREIIEHMQDGLQKDVALDIQDMADGKTEDLRILGD